MSVIINRYAAALGLDIDAVQQRCKYLRKPTQNWFINTTGFEDYTDDVRFYCCTLQMINSSDQHSNKAFDNTSFTIEAKIE